MRYLSLLSRPQPALLWLGQLTSTVGDRLYTMALLWITLQLTGSTQMMAAVTLAETIPLVLVGLVGGTLVDRWPRLRTMIWADLLRAALVMALPLIYLFGALQPWHLMVVGAGLGALEALFDPALRSTLSGLVPRDDLPAMHGLMDTTGRLARLLGPGMAGILLTWLTEVHFLAINSLSFVLSAGLLALLAVRWPPRPSAVASQPPGPGRSFKAELLAGWQITLGDRNLLLTLIVRGLNNVAWGAFTLGAPFLVSEQFQNDLGGYGLLLAAYGVGNLAGNLVLGNARLPGRPLAWFMAGWGVIGLGFILLGAAHSLNWALAATALAGLAGPMNHITMDTYIGQYVPDRDMGKVYSLQKVAVNGAVSLGLVAAGWLLTHLTAGQGISLAGGFMLLTAVAGMILQQPLVQRGRYSI